LELVEKAVESQDVHTRLAQKSELRLLDCLIDKRTIGCRVRSATGVAATLGASRGHPWRPAT